MTALHSLFRVSGNMNFFYVFKILVTILFASTSAKSNSETNNISVNRKCHNDLVNILFHSRCVNEKAIK